MWQSPELHGEVFRNDGACAPSLPLCGEGMGVGGCIGKVRVRLLVKAEKGVVLQAALAEWVGQVRLPANVRLAVEIDPQGFL